MVRKQTLEIAQDATLERIAVAAVSKLGVLVPPWAVMAVLLVVAAISHAKWGAPPAVVWVTMFGTFAAIALAALTWIVAHNRGVIGRTHTTISVGGAGLWFTVATITGVTPPFTLGVWFFGGGTLAVFWNIRAAIRQHVDHDQVADPLAWTFDRAKERFGLKGAKLRTTDVDDHRIKGKLQLPPGEKTPAEVKKKVDSIEGGLRFPPGSVVLADDEDDASQMHATFTDPRTMKRPLPWPGTSHPGGSVAEPLRVGLYQDMSPVLHTFTGHYLQMMGAIGSGKSIGGAWNYCAEIITRHDAAIFAIDLAKDDQTFGPLRPALHRLETSKAGAVDLLRKMHAAIPQRTAWLARRGYQKWARGCALTYWYLWVEEFPKLWDALGSADQEKFEQIVKEIRSAGGSVILSYQRSDYTQGPTIVRGQLGKMCFGVLDSDDSGFGLSERQKEAGAAPELWGNHQPGMAFLDVPGVPETHYAMALRTFAWGKTDQQANAAMKAHATAWPAAGKTIDEFTAALAEPATVPGQPGGAIPLPAADHNGQDDGQNNDQDDRDDEEVGDAVADYQVDDDPDPTLTAGPNDKITEPTPEEEGRFVIPEPTGQKMPPGQARTLVHDWLRYRVNVGKPTFTAGDAELRRVKDGTGNTSRGWIYKVLDGLTDAGVLTKDDSAATLTYTITDLGPLDDLEPDQAA